MRTILEGTRDLIRIQSMAQMHATNFQSWIYLHLFVLKKLIFSKIKIIFKKKKTTQTLKNDSFFAFAVESVVDKRAFATFVAKHLVVAGGDVVAETQHAHAVVLVDAILVARGRQRPIVVVHVTGHHVGDTVAQVIVARPRRFQAVWRWHVPFAVFQPTMAGVSARFVVVVLPRCFFRFQVS